MSDSSLSGIKLAAIMTAAALLPREASAFGLPGGIALLVVLFAFESDVRKTLFQSLAFAAVGGFVVSIAFLPIYSGLVGALSLGLPIVYVVWLLASLAVLLFDRMRPGTSPSAAFAPFPPQSAYPASVPAYAPPPSVPSRYDPVTAPAEPPPQPEYSQPSDFRRDPVHQEENAFESPTPDPVPDPVREFSPPTNLEHAPEPAPAPFRAGAAPIKGGKQAQIYVHLKGEGMNMLRSVTAEYLGRDFYHILDEMPLNENWEFGPGQVVRCQKRNLSSGKALVAVAEAPRAQ